MTRGERLARRAALIAVTAVLGSAVGATGALGAEVYRADTSHLYFVADAGEANRVTLTDDAVDYIFRDPSGVTAGAGCEPDLLDPTVARCRKAGSGVVVIDVGDQNDEVTVSDVNFAGLLQLGGPGNDTLRGSDGSATSSLVGGEGTDVYEAPGPAWDDVNYSDKPAGVTASLDDEPNDPDGENVPSTVDGLGGGPGDDRLSGSPGGEYLLGGAGDDSLDGLAGPDVLTGHGGDDEMGGGPGTDMVDYRETGYANEYATVTLDDVANDGRNGEADDVRATEWIQGSYGPDDLTGNGVANRIYGNLGNDTITGLGGADDLRGEYGNDTINSRDGEADTVSCGSGSDTANADEHDTVAADCETVARADPPPDVARLSDPSPSVSFSAPRENALLPPARASTVTVTASDDQGVARVDLLDDGRVVASDRSAPYSFSYRPGVDDVGPNVLTATAVDTANQATSATRRVRVARFRPRIRARARRLDDGVRVAGALRLPQALTRAQACGRGRVAVVVRWGDVTLARERVRLRRSCRFGAAAKLRPRGLADSDRLRVRVRFLGNSMLRPRAGRPIRVR